MDNSIQPPQLNTKKGKLAQFFGELSKSRKIALLVVVLIATLGAGWLVFSKAAVEPRDVTQQPFSRWSPWNMPIGSNADFSGPKLPNGYNHGTVQADAWTVASYIAKDTDPTITVNTEENGSVSLKAPSGVHSDGQDDGIVGVIQPDGITAYEFYDFKGNTAQLYSEVDLTGTGIQTGYPRAAQTSIYGGLLRASDMEKSQINHAFAISIDRGALKGCGFVWPAESVDEDSTGSGCNSTYTGSITFGSLIAIPPSVNINNLGLSGDGLKIAKAFQDYGGYIVDSSDSGGPKIWAEYPALVGKVDDAANSMSTIGPLLQIVKNSSPSSIGGGGNPRVCYASPIGNDANISNPNGNVTQPAGCEDGTNPPPPPPASSCPTGQVKNAEGECETPMSSNSSKGSVAFYGDSLTGDDYWKGYIGNGLNQALTTAGYIQVYSQGCGGMTMAQFVGAATPESICTNNTLEAHKADIAKSETVVVAFYSNDYESNKEQFKANAQTAIDKIKEYNPDVKQVVFVKGYFGGNEGFNDAFNELSTANPSLVKVIDISGVFSNDYTTCEDINNQNHPTDECSAKMATDIATKLGGLAPPSPTPACPSGQVKANGKCVDQNSGNNNGNSGNTGGNNTGNNNGNSGNTGGNNNGTACPSGQYKADGVCKPIVSTQEYKPAGTYDDNVAVYSSGWEVGQDENNYGYYNGSDHYANKANETMTFKFKGVNVKIYGINSSNMGTATVAIDGGSAATINYYGATKKGNQLVYDSGTLSDGNHTLVLKSTGQFKKLTSVTTASYNGNRQLATGNHEPETGTYVSVDRIVVTGAIDNEERCPEGQVKVDGKCVTPEPGDDCPEGQVKVDGKCVTPEVTCSANQSLVNGVCKDNEGKGGTTTQEKKIDSDITKKPEAKTVAEKLVNTGRFLLLPAIVAVAIILIASGLYVATKKKK